MITIINQVDYWLKASWLEELKVSDPNSSKIEEITLAMSNFYETQHHIVDDSEDESISDAKRMVAHIARVKLKYGSDYDVWLKWAESLYNISSDFTVTSTARNWVQDKTWKFEKQIDAVEKREILVGYKEHDRKRGRGDIDKDLAVIKGEEV